jgi:flavin reductase (DIM6/NTAB) family NADH-FMN oxidoreductase RutF
MTEISAGATTTGSSMARATFREVMARVATPVSIVTTLHDELPYGTTVSAFTSLSIDPPMVLVALDRGSDTLKSIRISGRFGLNILSAGQAETAATFASKGGSGKFDTTSWSISEGLPRIPGALGWITSTLADLVDGGDHVIALGLVQSAETTDGEPLVYHGRAFGSYLAH